MGWVCCGADWVEEAVAGLVDVLSVVGCAVVAGADVLGELDAGLCSAGRERVELGGWPDGWELEFGGPVGRTVGQLLDPVGPCVDSNAVVLDNEGVDEAVIGSTLAAGVELGLLEGLETVEMPAGALPEGVGAM